MATYERSYPESIPIPSIGADTEVRSPFQEVMPVPSVEAGLQYFIVYPVFAAFLYDASGPSYTDYTAEANSAAQGDIPLLPDPIGANDGFIVGGMSKYDFVTFEIGTIGEGTYTLNYYYWNGSAWSQMVVPTQLIYETINHFKTIDLVRLTIKERPANWSPITVQSKYFYPVYCKYVEGDVTTYPVGDQIWLGKWVAIDWIPRVIMF